MSDAPQNFKINSILYSESSFEEGRNRGLVPLQRSQSRSPHKQLPQPVDWNWVHVNKKSNQESLADDSDLEIISNSNLGDSFYAQEIEISLENDQNVGNLANPTASFKLSDKVSLLHNRHQPLKFGSNFKPTYRTISPTLRPDPFDGISILSLSSSSDRPKSQALDDYNTSFSASNVFDDEDVANSLTNSISVDSVASPSLKSVSPPAASQKNQNQPYTSIDHDMDSLLLPSPVINTSNLLAMSTSFSDEDYEKIPNLKGSENIPSNLDILNVYLAQIQMLQMDIKDLFVYIKSGGRDGPPSDPWSLMRIVTMCILAGYGSWAFYKAR